MDSRRKEGSHCRQAQRPWQHGGACIHDRGGSHKRKGWSRRRRRKGCGPGRRRRHPGFGHCKPGAGGGWACPGRWACRLRGGSGCLESGRFLWHRRATCTQVERGNRPGWGSLALPAPVSTTLLPLTPRRFMPSLSPATAPRLQGRRTSSRTPASPMSKPLSLAPGRTWRYDDGRGGFQRAQRIPSLGAACHAQGVWLLPRLPAPFPMCRR